MKKSIGALIMGVVILGPTFTSAEEVKIQKQAAVSYELGNEKMDYWMGSLKTYMAAPTNETFLKYLEKTTEFKETKMGLTDIKTTDWFYSDVAFLNKLEIVKGKDSEQIYKPQDKLTRAEAVSVLTRTHSVLSNVYDDKDLPKDVSKTHWAVNPIMSMKQYGIMSGYEDGSFQPDKTITRSEFISLIERTMKRDFESFGLQMPNQSSNPDLPFTDVKKTDWYYNSLKLIANEMGVGGYEDGTFKPNGEITRAEMATLIKRYLEYSWEMGIEFAVKNGQ